MYGAVATTDIASFFERIQQGRLEQQLVGLGVAASVALEIRQFLTRAMGTTMGLPQGSDPSSVLASVYLDSVDKYMLRRGYAFYRYVDDMYLFALDEAACRRGLRELEHQLRLIQLQLQPGKTEIIVGPAAMKAKIVDSDNDVSSIAKVYRAAPRSIGLKRVRARWKSVSRRKPFPSRIGKYLLRRLAANRDPLALNWCLRNLGVLDWLTRELGPYLSLYASRPSVQRKLLGHLRSPSNDSCAEECSLLRVMLSATRLDRDVLDYARQVLADRNKPTPSRQWAAILLGRHGDSTDHALVEVYHADDEMIARAAVVASQGMSAMQRGTVHAGVLARFPAQHSLVKRIQVTGRPSVAGLRAIGASFDRRVCP